MKVILNYLPLPTRIAALLLSILKTYSSSLFGWAWDVVFQQKEGGTQVLLVQAIFSLPRKQGEHALKCSCPGIRGCGVRYPPCPSGCIMHGDYSSEQVCFEIKSIKIIVGAELGKL
jgi:hypothetical protein